MPISTVQYMFKWFGTIFSLGALSNNLPLEQSLEQMKSF